MSSFAINKRWFDVWFAAFGQGDSGIWAPEGPHPPSLAYQLTTERIGGVPITVVHGATNDHTPRFDLTGKGKPDAGFAADALAALGGDMLVLDYLSRDSRAYRALVGRGQLPCRVELRASSPQVDCTQSFEAWWQARSSHKSTWARHERHYIDRSGARFELVTQWRDVAPLIDEIYAVESSGWKGSAGTAIAQAEATRTFYRELAAVAAAAGTLRLFLLRLEGRIIAFQLNTLQDGILDMLKIGFLEAHRKRSPGQVLLLQVLRWAFDQDDVRVFDMLGGSLAPDPYKLRFATHQEPLYRVRVFRRSPRGLLAMTRHSLAPEIKRRLVRLRPPSAGDHG